MLTAYFSLHSIDANPLIIVALPLRRDALFDDLAAAML
jgi:hypothetical protein